MVGNGTETQYSTTEIDKMIEDEKRAIVIFEGDVYDATNFKITHPGGPQYIENYIGKDMTEAFYDEEHTKIALRLLKELKIGTLTNEANNKKAVVTDHGDNRMKEVKNEDWREKIDPSKGTVWQVFTKLNQDEYMKFVNDPKHLTKPGEEMRMFDLDFIEMFSRTPWYHIGLFWTPMVLYKLWLGYHELSIPGMVLVFLFG